MSCKKVFLDLSENIRSVKPVLSGTLCDTIAMILVILNRLSEYKEIPVLSNTLCDTTHSVRLNRWSEYTGFIWCDLEHGLLSRTGSMVPCPHTATSHCPSEVFFHGRFQHFVQFNLN